MYTKTQERVKIIECDFFLFEMCILGNDPNARRLTKLEPNGIFNDFATSQEPIDEIDSTIFYFKDMD